ncbi:MAG: nucleoside triphosphate pyrophosphohydrolase [Spirochaetaceae bacterium]|jgi:tetrapyrrole methylase family protein/MazG family protein|nr:nucleoside triphosphate pyrophosphohydrolase [Spirochaetaceae bacterium]
MRQSTAEEAFKGLYDTVARLRAPGGCPWDREQTPASLRKDLIEETYECVEAINGKEAPHIQEELGDLLLLITMLAYMHEEEGAFSVAETLEGITAKLIRRHPHVFAGVEVKDSAEVISNWARIKVEQEGRKPKDSVLDEVSTALPVLDRAYGLQKKAARAGFDWADSGGVFDKVEEELAEVREALAGAEGTPPSSPAGPEERERLEEELGDLLFSVVNLCRFLGADPSTALLRANTKFVSRFTHVEGEMKKGGHEMKRENLPLMDRLWNEAKLR